MQYSKKIIALFFTVCLLVTSLCVPVSAASGTMLYNGVELPVLPEWDKVSYPYAVIFISSDIYVLHCFNARPYVENSGSYLKTPNCSVLEWKCSNGEWLSYGSISSFAEFNYVLPFWTDFDLLKTDGSVFMAATAPVDTNPFTGTMTHYTGHFGSDFFNTTYHVDGLTDSDTYFIRGYCYQDSSLVITADSPAWIGPGTYCTVEFSGLSPSTTYDFEFVLYVNDEETSVTDTRSVTTLAASSVGGDSGDGDGTGDGGGTSGGCVECPSILSAILSAITTQTNFLSTWQQAWTIRMDSLESTLSRLIPVPDPTETALKESVKDTTKEVTDSLFADDAPTKVTASDVKDVAQIGAAASSMFDFGVGVGSLFDVLNDLSFLSVFTQEMVDGMNTVTTPFIISDSDFDSAEYYYKNYEEVKEFVTGG